MQGIIPIPRLLMLSIKRKEVIRPHGSMAYGQRLTIHPRRHAGYVLTVYVITERDGSRQVGRSLLLCSWVDAIARQRHILRIVTGLRMFGGFYKRGINMHYNKQEVIALICAIGILITMALAILTTGV